MNAVFRDPIARDRAWARYYRSRGLAPCTQSIRVPSTAQRLAAYAVRKARTVMQRF